ncbi:MAG: SRPBCC family protein [Ignavibacteriales bacterium]|nr:SRPBCC family protein [Ignavibacteriales bacterium]
MSQGFDSVLSMVPVEITNSILMQAPLEKVFETAADLSLWPKILPHYRWIRFHERSETRNVATMAARRKWIPVRWTSEQQIDRVNRQIHFHHLTAFTRGMHVVWSFTPTPVGVEVSITHAVPANIPVIGKFVAGKIIGSFFIHSIARQTLTHMKRYVEEGHVS